MPAIIVLLVLMGVAGSIQLPNNNQSGVQSDGISVSAEFSNPDTYTGLIPDSVQSNINTVYSAEATNETVVVEEVAAIEDVTLSVRSAINVDFRRATIRGDIEVPADVQLGTLFFVYSDSQSRLISNTGRTDTYEDAVESDSVIPVRISQTTRNSTSPEKSISSLRDNERYYYRLCVEESQEVLLCSPVSSFDTVEDVNQSSYYSAPSASTQRAEDIQGTSATLKGSYRINSAENITAFYVYGESQRLVASIPEDYDEYRDVEEAGDNLQKVKLGSSVSTTVSPELVVEELDEDTLYYFRLCVAYDDDTATEIRCGNTLNFTTDDKDRDKPDIRSSSVVVGGATAVFTGSIDMEDYNDGHAFLVYGTNESNIQRVANSSSFSRVYQNGNNIQRVSLDVDFDGRDTLTRNVTDLLMGATYYYRFCVEFVAENNFGYERSFLECGDVQNFTTQ